MRRRDRIRHLANWLNLSTPVGLLVAGAGGARVRRHPDGIFVAEGYRFAFPVAGAFTIGDVVTTASTMDRLEARVPGVYAHEVRHAWQFAATGVWFLPAYLVASAWSLARTGSPALRNPLRFTGYDAPSLGTPPLHGADSAALAAEFGLKEIGA